MTAPKRETESFVSPRPSMFPEANEDSRGFKEHDLITCKSKVHVDISLRTVMSFTRLGELELVSFDPRHGARSPPIGKRILVGRYNDCFYPMVQ